MTAPASLFDEESRERAARHGADSHFRWLAVADDPEAVALRAVLERGFALAGPAARTRLRNGLEHERWGQHVGALAHLLVAALFDAAGWDVEVEPELDGKSPDLLVTRRVGADGADAMPGRVASATDAAPSAAPQELRMLVEVRAISGAGRFPWEQRRADGQRMATEEREALAEAVYGVLQRKAETYADLVRRLHLPFVICLYEDKDDVLAGLVAESLHGRGGAARQHTARPPEPRTPLGAVLVLRREDDEAGRVLVSGDLFDHPGAARPLPLDASLPWFTRNDAAGRTVNAPRERRREL